MQPGHLLPPIYWSCQRRVLHQVVFHLGGELTDRNETGVNEGGMGKDSYLCSPCPITCHPLAIDLVLVVGVVIDLPWDKIPFPLKDWVAKESLSTFQWIMVE